MRVYATVINRLIERQIDTQIEKTDRYADRHTDNIKTNIVTYLSILAVAVLAFVVGRNLFVIFIDLRFVARVS